MNILANDLITVTTGDQTLTLTVREAIALRNDLTRLIVEKQLPIVKAINCLVPPEVFDQILEET